MRLPKKGVSKASGLLYLGKKLGIAPEEMMVFGDSGNDLDMIKMAGIGVAMANAEPEVLKAADFVTKSNNENGVGDFGFSNLLKNCIFMRRSRLTNAQGVSAGQKHLPDTRVFVAPAIIFFNNLSELQKYLARLTVSFFGIQ